MFSTEKCCRLEIPAHRCHNCTPKSHRYPLPFEYLRLRLAVKRLSPEPLKFRRIRSGGRTKVLRLHLAFCIIPALAVLIRPIRGESCKQCRTRTEEVVAMAIRPSSRPCPMSVSLRIFGSSFHFAVPGLRSIFWVPQLRR